MALRKRQKMTHHPPHRPKHHQPGARKEARKQPGRSQEGPCLFGLACSLARLLFGDGGAGSGHFFEFLREILPKTSILARILIAQSVERKARNLVVVGSSPTVLSKLILSQGHLFSEHLLRPFVHPIPLHIFEKP